MKWRLGDRFRDIHHHSVWEFSYEEEDGRYWGICVDGGNSAFAPGERDWWGFDNKTVWEYVGNFSKSDNFNSLYEKLNESTH